MCVLVVLAYYIYIYRNITPGGSEARKGSVCFLRISRELQQRTEFASHQILGSDRKCKADDSSILPFLEESLAGNALHLACHVTWIAYRPGEYEVYTYMSWWSF